MSASDALPPLTRDQADALVAELRRIYQSGGPDGQPRSDEFVTAAFSAVTEMYAEVDRAECTPAPAQPVLFVMSRAA